MRKGQFLTRGFVGSFIILFQKQIRHSNKQNLTLIILDTHIGMAALVPSADFVYWTLWERENLAGNPQCFAAPLCELLLSPLGPGGDLGATRTSRISPFRTFLVMESTKNLICFFLFWYKTNKQLRNKSKWCHCSSHLVLKQEKNNDIQVIEGLFPSWISVRRYFIWFLPLYSLKPNYYYAILEAFAEMTDNSYILGSIKVKPSSVRLWQHEPKSCGHFHSQDELKIMIRHG